MPDVRLQEQVLRKLDELVERCGSLVGHVASIDSRLRETTPAEPQRLYTRKEAAHILGVTTRTIDRRVRTGDLEIVRHGPSVRVVGASLQGLGKCEQHPAAEGAATMSQALLPDRPEQLQPGAGRNAQTQAPAAGTDKAGGGRNAPLLPEHACPCPPAQNEICDLLRQVLAAVRSIKMAGPQPLPPWSRSMTFAEAARRYGVRERTFRGWLKMPNSNGIRHKRFGNMVMIDQRDLPASQRGP